MILELAFPRQMIGGYDRDTVARMISGGFVQLDAVCMIPGLRSHDRRGGFAFTIG